MSLPVVSLSGSPREQGFRHGRELKDRVHGNLELYFEQFESETKLSPAEVLRRARLYLDVIESQSPDFFAAMQGVAEGAGADFERIAALNVRYELIYDRLTEQAMTDGCTAFAVSPVVSANGNLLMGQNWDWIPGVQGAGLKTEEPDGTKTLSFTEAGIVGGKIGLNSAGIGLAVNGMTSVGDDWARLKKPFHVRCYEILRQESFDAALHVVEREERSCSTNFLIAQAPDREADIEAAAEKSRRIGWGATGRQAHTNHFLDPQSMGIKEPPAEWLPCSRSRFDRMNHLLESKPTVGISDIQRFLSDHQNHPNSICRHIDEAKPEGERIVTITSVVMDLDERKMYLTDGSPCEEPYAEIAL